METIMKLPFLLAIIAALITGFLSMMENKDLNQTCYRMIIALIIFYFIGTIMRSTFTSIVEEQDKMKLEAERLEREELQNMQAEKTNQEGHLGKNLDLVADNLIDDGFSPLDLSQAVKTKMKE